MQLVHVYRRTGAEGRALYSITTWDTGRMRALLAALGIPGISFNPHTQIFVVTQEAIGAVKAAVIGAGLSPCAECQHSPLCRWWALLDEMRANVRRNAEDAAREAEEAAQARSPWGRPGARRRTQSPRTALPSPQAAMARAAALLGVSVGASEAEVQAAFRRKILTAHPDRGGSEHDAIQLVSARTMLLSDC